MPISRSNTCCLIRNIVTSSSIAATGSIVISIRIPPQREYYRLASFECSVKTTVDRLVQAKRCHRTASYIERVENSEGALDTLRVKNLADHRSGPTHCVANEYWFA